MIFLNFIKKNKILAFTVGVLIFVVVIPGIFSLKGSFQSDRESMAKAVTTTGDPNTTASLGINLTGIADYSTELPFLDAFKSARQWWPECQPEDNNGCPEGKVSDNIKLNLDANGWIKSLPGRSDNPKYSRAATLILRELKGLYPGGKYIVLYDGEGTITYRYDGEKNEAESKPGRDVLNVKAGDGGILISITSTDPKRNGSYIRNIRVIQEAKLNSYESGEIFNPIFLDKIKNFKAIRFMDWMSTNNSQQKEWANRPKVEDASYAWKGVPVEIMVALANKIKADAWFNMPHMATDEYITNFARKVKDNLAPGKKAYVEFSNEVWNWQFDQSHYALQQGKAIWGQDKADAFAQWYGMRAAQTADIWKSVFSNQNKRVVSVISTQTAYKGLENYILDCPYWVAQGNKPCYQHTDAYAITGYFSGGLGDPNNASVTRSWMNESERGFSKAIQQLRDGSVIKNSNDSLLDTYKDFLYHAEIAKKRGLQFVAYEGGQSITANQIVGSSNEDPLINFYAEINRRPEMYALHTELLEHWRQAGGTLFNHFSDVTQSGKYGSWGALEYVAQNGSPKYNALMDFINKKH